MNHARIVVAMLVFVARIASAETLFSADEGKTWTPAGLSGVPVDEILPDPSDPKAALAFTGGKSPGLQVTIDGGKTWRERSPGFSVRCVAIDPSNSRNLWAGGDEGKIASSTDRGITWTKGSIGKPAESTMMAGVMRNVTALAVSGKRLFAAGGQGDGFAAWSDDGGVTWTGADVEKGWGYNWAAAVAKNAVLVGGDQGLASSTDNGKSFKPVPGVNSCLGVGGRFSVSPDGLNIVYSFRGQLVTSADGGKTWAPLPSPEGATIASVVWSGKRMLAVAPSGKMSKEGDMSWFEADGKTALVASEDGKTWKAVEGVKEGVLVISATGDGKGIWLGTK